MIRTEDFDYHLPDQLISQFPQEPRDSCRLLGLERRTGQITHHFFYDLPDLIKKGDRLVFNNTRVIPARVYGTKKNGVQVEILFTERINSHSWKAIVRPGRRLPSGTVVNIGPNSDYSISINSILPDGGRIVFSDQNEKSNLSIDKLIELYGHIPLPPYITRPDLFKDREDYQTVFAQYNGAVAAPTAGLHFTDTLINKIKQNGIDISFLTLHVGIGTFRPVKESDPRNHPIHEEPFILPENTVNEILDTKSRGGRIIAIGTTVVRVLEHCSAINGILQPGCGTTRLMILPPYNFNIIDGLITNFHVPKSTLLMLVGAFAGIEPVFTAYKNAVEMGYRFLSYGDAMLIM